MSQRKRSISSFTRAIAAPPETVFPLLCPTREYEWIEPWQCDLVYSDSGVAETDCVFITGPFQELGPETWTCSRFEPPARIDYVRMSAHTVIRLELKLERQGTGSRITATFVMTALDDIGDAFVGRCHAGTCEEHFKACFIMLDAFVRTGKMLPAKEAQALAA
jgi:hypothetical protein